MSSAKEEEEGGGESPRTLELPGLEAVKEKGAKALSSLLGHDGDEPEPVPARPRATAASRAGTRVRAPQGTRSRTVRQHSRAAIWVMRIAAVDGAADPRRPARGGPQRPLLRSSRRRRRARSPGRRARRLVWLIPAALALAALSLLAPWALAFDPYAWLQWGRDVLRLSLDTSAGPSWKPLPVVVTTPLSLTGGAAPALWLVVARAGGLLALAGAARVAWRLTGSGIAAATAAAAMALGPWWWFNTALGNSEGLLAAAVLWAIVAHLEGRPRLALGLLLAAALMRPEAWAFLGLYGLWLWRADPGARRLVAAAFAAVPVLWFGPDVIGAGGAIGASHAARANASVGSAALSDHPALTVLADAVRQLTVPAALAALAGVVLGPAAARWLGLGALAWVVEVAVMTALGYAGNPRYLDAAAAVGCALAGVGVAAVGTRVAAARGRASEVAARE